MSIRRRLTPAESRQAALEAARDLLIEGGPQSVTLKAVAQRVGRTHANLLHHFGSAAELQRDLAAFLAAALCDTIHRAVQERRPGPVSVRHLVDIAFDAFDRHGAGALASWMLLNTNRDALDPVFQAIRGLLRQVEEEAGIASPDPQEIDELSASLLLLALGDSLLGETVTQVLNVRREAARERAVQMLEMFLAERRAGRI